MKKVVERVQRENETLKKSSANQEKVAALEQENEKLKVVASSHVSVLTYLLPYYSWLREHCYFRVTTRNWRVEVKLSWTPNLNLKPKDWRR